VRDDRSVDDHARRVVLPVLEALARYEAGLASVADLQASAAGAAGALDNASAALRAALMRLDSDLEMVRFATPAAEERAAVETAVVDLRRLTAD
jgi:hypothetical protein